jgi:hypothetical protein
VNGLIDFSVSNTTPGGWPSFTSDGEGPLDTSAQAVAQKMVSVCNIQ